MTEAPLPGDAAWIFEAMGNSRRLRILKALKSGEMRVNEIAEHVSLSQSATSQHLGKLRAAGLVMPRKQSQEVFYSLSTPHVLEIIRSAEYLIGMRHLTPSVPYTRKWA